MDTVKGKLSQTLPSRPSHPALDKLTPIPATPRWVWKLSLRSSAALWAPLPPQLTSAVILSLGKSRTRRIRWMMTHIVFLGVHLSSRWHLVGAFTVCDLISQIPVKEYFQSCSGRDESST